MQDDSTTPKRNNIQKKAAAIKPFRCKNLIAVLENPVDMVNIGSVIRNVNALGVEKVYVIDRRKSLPNDWYEMREKKKLSQVSVSAVKWTFVKRFDTREGCLAHLEKGLYQLMQKCVRMWYAQESIKLV